ncbi:Serine/threonine-protein phosphatase pgam5, mitochondrial [Chamberlinius hualienensis]
MSRGYTTRRLVNTIAGIGVIVGGGVVGLKLIRNNGDKKLKDPSESANGPDFIPTVNASWTTNFTPSVRWDYDWDKKSPASLQKPRKNKSEKSDENNNEIVNNELPKPTASRHLILIRHGQYYESADTDAKRILTPLGREQAAFTGARLKELGHPYTILTFSSMARAKETAEIILKNLKGLESRSCDLIREGAPIPPEPPVGHWRPQRNFFQDGPRIEAAFRRYFYRASVSQKEDSYEILACHANVIRYFVCRALQLPPEAWLRFSLNHGSITWITIRPSGRVSISAVGDAGHMPSNKLSIR